MKHLIIVKFKENIWNREDAASREMLADIKKIFNRTKQIEGVHTVNIYENVTPRPNRHDLMIEMEMDPEALLSAGKKLESRTKRGILLTIDARDGSILTSDR